VSLREIGILQYDAKRPEVGRDELDAARRHLEDLVSEFPAQPDYRAALDETLNLLEQLDHGL
jgi:hypothetical protein